MKKPETIEDLNKLISWRVLKVVYITAITVVSLLVIYINFDGTSEYRNDYWIECTSGNMNEFWAVKEKLLDPSDDTSLFIEQLYKACNAPEDTLNTVDTCVTMGGSGCQKLMPFTITDLNVREKSLVDALTETIAGLLILLIIAEIFRRLSYYIILGNFSPTKK